MCPITDYQSVAPTINRLAAAFARRRGIPDIDEQISLATYIYWEVYRREIENLPPTCTLRTAAVRWVYWGLQDAHRKGARQWDRLQTHAAHLTPATPPAWDTADWLAGLPPDARYAAWLALQQPGAVGADATARGGCPRNVRAAVRACLVAQGWDAPRINAAFAAVRGAL